METYITVDKGIDLVHKIGAGIFGLIFKWDKKGSPGQRLEAYSELRSSITDMFKSNTECIMLEETENGQIRQLDFYKAAGFKETSPLEGKENGSGRDYVRGRVIEETAHDGETHQTIYLEYSPRADFSEQQGRVWQFVEARFSDKSGIPKINKGKVKYFEGNQPTEPQIISSSRDGLTSSEANLVTFLSKNSKFR